MVLEAKSNWGWCAFCLRLPRMMPDNWRFHSFRAFLQVNKRIHVNYWSKSCIIRYCRSIQDIVTKHWINPWFFLGCLWICVVCLLHIVPMVALFLSCPMNLWIRDTYHVCNVSMDTWILTQLKWSQMQENMKALFPRMEDVKPQFSCFGCCWIYSLLFVCSISRPWNWHHPNNLCWKSCFSSCHKNFQRSNSL